MGDERRTIRQHLACGLAVGLLAATTASPAQAATSGGLLEGLLGTTLGLVDGVLRVVTAGWDDGASTSPTTMGEVTAAVGAEAMWARGYDGSGIDVALIDSGVVPVQGLSAPTKVVNGPDLSFESQSSTYRHLDTFGHGTHMAGIIAGNDGTSTGFKGVAPGARLVNVKVATRDGAADISQVIAAIDWVVQHRNDGMNVRVLSLSFGTDGIQNPMIDPLAHAVESAWRNGVVVVVAGGNDGDVLPSLTNPAHDPRVIAVGAVDINGTVSALDDRVAPFSSRGSVSRFVDVVAPGVSIASLRDPGSTIDSAHPGSVVATRFFRGSGTSQATAVTAGAVALLLDARPTLTPDQVKALLRTSATPLLKDTARAQGAGRLNVDLAARTLVPVASGQGGGASSGTGSLEAARGSEHLTADGIELRGEIDVMGVAWSGSAWAPLSSAGSAWSGAYWRSVKWIGTCWCGSSWAQQTWGSAAWTGKSWSGKSWSSDLWSGKSWSGKSWSGTSWSGKSWSGKSWSGSNWMASGL